ncbi:hypothetical protein CVT25_000269 [Psilocybe cyanescens]|uniref:Uncharacterized protein n=1 Tax=Psilocybe cyanescens TaxID=93625 RepID=A0A409XM83_PSICY|nr:hypothetical protein CVT25_000269 [Psilocybe cyanescens]
MSFFTQPRTSSPQLLAPEDRNDGVPNAETQPLIQRAANSEDIKQESDTQPALTTTPPSPQTSLGLLPSHPPRSGEGPIRLAPDEDQATQSRTGFHLWPTTGRFTLPDRFRITREMRPEDRGILDDMRRGTMIIVTTPIAFTGMALYSCGMIIEGVALLLKGVGSLGGRVLMRRRQRSQATQSQSADPLWV